MTRLTPLLTIALTLSAALLGTSPAHAHSGEDETAYAPFGLPGYLLPHFGVGYSFGTRVADGIIDDSLNAPSAWLGVTYYAQRSRVTPMLQLSVEFEHRVTPTDTSLTYIMPTARVGLGWIGCLDDTDSPNYESAWLPCATLYALGGIRPGDDDRRPMAGRVGVGVNIPFLALAGCYGGFVLPSMFEGIIELDTMGRPSYIFRIGLGI